MEFKNSVERFIADYFTSDITNKRVCVVLLAALLFCICLFVVYRFTVKNEFYSKDFNRSMALMVVVTAGVVLGLQSNLVISLGMVGALSIVRYRTAVKSSLDLLFLFWAVATGILCGASLFTIALVMFLVVTVAILVLGKLEMPITLRLLAVRCASAEDAEAVAAQMKTLSTFCRVKNKTVTKTGTELVLEFKSRDQSAMERALAGNEAVSEYSMLSYDRENR